jgi:hypothetical protein
MMNKGKKLFNFSNWLFWITLTIILLLALPFFKSIFFNENAVKEWLVIYDKNKTDSLQLLKKEKIKVQTRVINWNWKDYNNKQYSIKFTVSVSDILAANKFRREYSSFNSQRTLYMDFISASMGPLDSMAKAMRIDIARKNISGLDVLNYVVTAIQTPPYTLINGPSESDPDQCPCNQFGTNWLNDCNPRPDGKGCCNNVAPYAVFTPAEFIMKKAGDCDTKSLIAYALLKKMGYDAALIVGNVQLGGSISGHAMLAVANIKPVIPTRYLEYNGLIYFPWEVTGFYPMNQLGNMSMWESWTDWEVICN